MGLINFSLNNRFAVLAAAIALCVLGVAVIPGITIDILPDFKKPVVVSFFSYPGLKELEHRIVENIHQAENFSDRWKSFTKELEKELGKEIVGTTNGQAP